MKQLKHIHNLYIPKNIKNNNLKSPLINNSKVSKNHYYTPYIHNTNTKHNLNSPYHTNNTYNNPYTNDNKHNTIYTNYKHVVEKEFIYKYKLTFLRLAIIFFSTVSIYLGINGDIEYTSPYLEEILNFSKETASYIVQMIFLITGIIGMFISLIVFEHIQTNKYFYIPLGLVNIIIGIVISTITLAISKGKAIIFSSYYLTISNIKVLKDSIDYFKNTVKTNFNYDMPLKDIEQYIKEQQSIIGAPKLTNLEVTNLANQWGEHTLQIKQQQRDQLITQLINDINANRQLLTSNNNTVIHSIYSLLYNNAGIIITSIGVIGLGVGLLYYTNLWYSINNAFSLWFQYRKKTEDVTYKIIMNQVDQNNQLGIMNQAIGQNTQDILHLQNTVYNTVDIATNIKPLLIDPMLNNISTLTTRIDTLESVVNILKDSLIQKNADIITLTNQIDTLETALLALSDIVQTQGATAASINTSNAFMFIGLISTIKITDILKKFTRFMYMQAGTSIIPYASKNAGLGGNNDDDDNYKGFPNKTKFNTGCNSDMTATPHQEIIEMLKTDSLGGKFRNNRLTTTIENNYWIKMSDNKNYHTIYTQKKKSFDTALNNYSNDSNIPTNIQKQYSNNLNSFSDIISNIITNPIFLGCSTLIIGIISYYILSNRTSNISLKLVPKISLKGLQSDYVPRYYYLQKFLK